MPEYSLTIAPGTLDSWWGSPGAPYAAAPGGSHGVPRPLTVRNRPAGALGSAEALRSALYALPQFRLGLVPILLVCPAFSGMRDMVGAFGDHLLREHRHPGALRRLAGDRLSRPRWLVPLLRSFLRRCAAGGRLLRPHFRLGTLRCHTGAPLMCDQAEAAIPCLGRCSFFPRSSNSSATVCA